MADRIDIDLDALERAALAATPGPWKVGRKVQRFVYSERGDAVCECDCSVDGGDDDENNGAFIAAANPAAILALIRRLREAEENLQAANLRANANAEMLKADEADLAESRANDRTGMYWLSSIKQAVGWEGDLPGLVENLKAVFTLSPDVPTPEQDWAAMDGASAFLAIERHADNWADTRHMMERWLAAKTAKSEAARIEAQADVQRLIEERNRLGLAISRALLSFEHPDEHPLLGRLQMIAAAGRLAQRYEKLRKFNVAQFGELYQRNLLGEGSFDELVDGFDLNARS